MSLIKRVEDIIDMDLNYINQIYSVEEYAWGVEIKAHPSKNYEFVGAVCMLNPDDPDMKKKFCEFLRKLYEVNEEFIKLCQDDMDYIMDLRNYEW